MKGLKFWQNIAPFLAITTVCIRTELYKKVITQFESDVKDYYKIGGKTFLTKRNIVGCNETFYMHCLRFYLPINAKDTYDDYNLGLGIFTMQGYEHQNKQLKLIGSRFNNHTNFVICQNLKFLYDNFKRK